MKKPVITIIQYLFFLCLGILFVWLSVREIDGEQWLQIKASLRKARLWLIIPVCITLLLSHYSRAIRWKILMEPLGYKPSTFNTFAAVMIGYLVNAGVPRLGEVVKCTLLSRYEKVRADKLIGTIVMERAVDVVCLGIVFLLALLFEGHIIGDFVGSLFGDFFKNNAGETSVTKILLYASVFFVFIAIVYFLLKRFGHIDAVGKIKNVIKGILHGLQSIRYIKHKGWFVFHTFLIWSLYLLSTTVGIYALQETSHLGVEGGLTTLAVGSVGMVITPGGIGAYPVLVSQLMEVYGLNKEVIGTTLGWLLWTVQTFIIVLGGLILIVLFSFFNKNKQPVEARARLTDEDIAPF
jgi:glycosyltransferase 2 family protein